MFLMFFTNMLHICYIMWWLEGGQNGGKGRESGEQSVWVQTISNLWVAGSSPAGRARNNNQPFGWFYFL